MAGLRLISTYSSDSDNNDEETVECENAKSLPLPSCIKTWKGVTHHEEVVDDPSEHDGRLRSFKHERGNWATLVYINYIPSSVMHDWINLLVAQIPFQGNTVYEQFHISLTRTLILKFHWIDSFVDSLKKLCQNTRCLVLEIQGLKVYCNEERTRTFIGLKCDNSDGTLKHLTASLNNLLSEYELSPFYEDASHHVSILWSLGDREAYLTKALPILSDSLNNFLADNANDSYIHINELCCKIGNKFYIFPLR